MTSRRYDDWGDWPGDICRIMHDGTGWRHPSDCHIDDTGHVTGANVHIGYDSPCLVVATTTEFQPKPGWNWTWCLLLVPGVPLCWVPSSMLRRLG